MRSQKNILTLFTEIAKLVAQEAACNAGFAARLESILGDSPSKKRSPGTATPGPAKTQKAKGTEPLPDLITEYQKRGADEFHFWLRDLPVATLKALIKHHDMDASRRASRWTDAGRMARLILDQIEARMKRGSAFLPLKPTPSTSPDGDLKAKRRRP